MPLLDTDVPVHGCSCCSRCRFLIDEQKEPAASKNIEEGKDNSVNSIAAFRQVDGLFRGAPSSLRSVTRETVLRARCDKPIKESTKNQRINSPQLISIKPNCVSRQRRYLNSTSCSKKKKKNGSRS